MTREQDIDRLLTMARDWTDVAVVRDAPARVPHVVEQLIAEIERLRSAAPQEKVSVLLQRMLDAPVPPTIATDEPFRDIYCQGYRHALRDALTKVQAAAVDPPPDTDDVTAL
jgi:hypothetical protein